MTTHSCPRCSAAELELVLSPEWLKVSCHQCNYDFFLPPDYPTNIEQYHEEYQS